MHNVPIWFVFMIISLSKILFYFSTNSNILMIFSNQVFTNDGLPSTICDPCRLIMDYTYRFKQMCRKSETALKQFPLTGIWQKQLEHPAYPSEELRNAALV